MGAFFAECIFIFMAVFFGRFLIDSMSESRIKFISGLHYLLIGFYELIANVILEA